jgi:hypothetical protein
MNAPDFFATSPSATPRDRLLQAQALVSQAFELVDEVGPQLEEPERSAVCGFMGLRDDVGSIVRRLGALVAFLGHAERGG